jgi:hypothetical protein
MAGNIFINYRREDDTGSRRIAVYLLGIAYWLYVGARLVQA